MKSDPSFTKQPQQISQQTPQQQPGTQAKQLSAWHQSKARRAGSRNDEALSRDMRMRPLLVEAVMAAWGIYLDQHGYPPTSAEIIQITRLTRQQIDIVLHLLAGQGRLHRSRFGWRPVRQASAHPTEAIYAYLAIYWRFYNLSPTYDEMSKATYLSPSALRVHLRQLETSGHIQRSGSRLRTIQVSHADSIIQRALQWAAEQFPAFDIKTTTSEFEPYEFSPFANSVSPEGVGHG